MSHGGVLSSILFNIAIRIGESIPRAVKWLMFADDLLLYTTSKDLQASLPLPGKGHFEPYWMIENTMILPQSDLTYLGIILGRKLNWHKHIKESDQKAPKTLNLIRSITKISWGEESFLSSNYI